MTIKITNSIGEHTNSYFLQNHADFGFNGKFQAENAELRIRGEIKQVGEVFKVEVNDKERK
jgi:hypothetical protein